jgi:hypothetical protein
VTALRRRLARTGPIALLPVAAFAVHQVRYLLAYGWSDGAELRMTGHSYLHSIVPWIVLLLALAVGGLLRAAGRALGGELSVPRYAASLTGLWVLCTVALVAIFVCQEFLEGLFATGHPSGLAGIFGYGGWWALPAAGCAGFVLAALFHGALWVIGEVVRRRAGVRFGAARRAAARFAWCDVALPRLAPLADGCSGRGPPA